MVFSMPTWCRVLVRSSFDLSNCNGAYTTWSSVIDGKAEKGGGGKAGKGGKGGKGGDGKGAKGSPLKGGGRAGKGSGGKGRGTKRKSVDFRRQR